MREYIIGNFKGDTKEEIETGLKIPPETSSFINEISAECEEDTLFGLGVLFELYWKNISDNEKENVVNIIYNSIND